MSSQTLSSPPPLQLFTEPFYASVAELALAHTTSIVVRWPLSASLAGGGEEKHTGVLLAKHSTGRRRFAPLYRIGRFAPRGHD